TSAEELDALADPRHIRELVHLIRGGATIPAGEGVLEFRALEGFARLGTELKTARLITSEQSNTSIVFDEELILKVFRRLEPSVESLALLTATVDEEISRIFFELPEDVEALDPIRGRGEEVRESLALLSHAGSFGKTIRTHGDLHLGQTLWAQDRNDWLLIDF